MQLLKHTYTQKPYFKILEINFNTYLRRVLWKYKLPFYSNDNPSSLKYSKLFSE